MPEIIGPLNWNSTLDGHWIIYAANRKMQPFRKIMPEINFNLQIQSMEIPATLSHKQNMMDGGTQIFGRQNHMDNSFICASIIYDSCLFSLFVCVIVYQYVDCKYFSNTNSHV